MKRIKLDFVIVGPEKCGTSWLDFALRSLDAEAFPTSLKETFYFDRHFHLGPDWHGGLFDDDTAKAGEVSPSYFAQVVAIDRLREHNPDLKIVIVLRNPYVRAASHLMHLARRGAVKLSQAGLTVPEAVWNAASISSHYKAFSDRWAEAFPNGQILYVCYDDIASDPAGVLNAIADHIGFSARVDEAQARSLADQTIFEAAIPASTFLSRVLYKTSRVLQSWGATKFVTAVQQSPVRKLIERKGKDLKALKIALQEYAYEKGDFEEDILFAELVLGRNLLEWRPKKTHAPMPG